MNERGVNLDTYELFTKDRPRLSNVFYLDEKLEIFITHDCIHPFPLLVLSTLLLQEFSEVRALFSFVL